MDSPGRKKRKSNKSSCSVPTPTIGSGQDRLIKKHKHIRPQDSSPGRGLKRKLGCVVQAGQFGKRNLTKFYELGSEIGSGRFGSVTHCQKRITGERFACKILLKNTGEEETAHKEVEIMQHLSGHSGIVILKDSFQDSERYYLVMELCSGGRLLDLMSKEGGRVSEKKAASVIRELMEIVKYCHEMGVVHRDIKPENILLTDTGRLKLADFGLAARIADGQKMSGMVGTPAYMAPEMLKGKYTEKVDVWAAGVLMHALLLGMLPFQGASREAVFHSVRTVCLDFRSAAWDPVSPTARDLASRMLARDVSARLTADEVLRHPWILSNTEWSTNGPGPATNPKPPNPVPAPTPRVVQQRVRPTYNTSHSSESEDKSCSFVDALAAAISRMEISEPKRTRLCGPAPVPVLPLDLKPNLCTAF